MLDLFCREGGASEGYRQAGARWITGIDWKDMRRHRADEFLCRDVFNIELAFIRSFDLVHASPVCQGLTEMNNDKSRWTNQIPGVRLMLRRAGVPYVIENVRAARPHLIDPVSLKGTMFDLHMVTRIGCARYDLSRERLFETNWPLAAPPDPGDGRFPIANVLGGHLRCRSGEHRTGKGTGRSVDFAGEDRPALARQLMGMPWATMDGMSKAVPPAYTRWIGEQFLGWRE